MKSKGTNRRDFLRDSSMTLGAGAVAVQSGLSTKAFAGSPAVITSEKERPQVDQGLQIGDVLARRGVVWSRSDRPARMWVEASYHESFANSMRLRGPFALADTDYTTRIDLSGLRADSKVYVKVTYESLDNSRCTSAPVYGEFVTAPERARDIHFLWSGDTAGQGWGINPDFGGMKIYSAMKNEGADFFIHSGDTIYADGPISEFQTAEDGSTWRNIVTEEVSKVAETLDEYRGRYKYNLLDENMLAFNATTPQIWQWDDHEVTNNWSSSKDLTDDDRYTEKNVPLLIARGATAFLEYAPIRPHNAREEERVYRKISYGSLLDVIVVDMRSYRGPNTANDQTEAGPETRFFGARQLAWIKKALKESTATWKVVASDMPIGLVVADGDNFENMANGMDMLAGRELEMAELLRHIKTCNIENVVWLTADVHYCAAHHYSPERAVFQDFAPFWEFVAGPLNAGTFGPNDLDNTFGPQVVFEKAPEVANSSPFAGLQFYGDVKIDGYSGQMTVSLKDLNGAVVYSKTLDPVV